MLRTDDAWRSKFHFAFPNSSFFSCFEELENLQIWRFARQGSPISDCRVCNRPSAALILDLCNLGRNTPQNSRKVGALKDDGCLRIIEGLNGWLMFFVNAKRGRIVVGVV